MVTRRTNHETEKVPENTIAKGAASANSGPSPTETAAECITRSLQQIHNQTRGMGLLNHPIDTCIRDIRDAALEIEADRDRLVGLLEEALVELQAGGGL